MFHLEATATGLIKTIMRATNYNTTASSATTGYIGVQVDKNSNVEYLISHKDKFRNAIECIGYKDEEAWLRATVGHSCKNQFEITGSTTTVNEVTFTVNKTTGTVKATGAASPAASRVFTIGTFTFKPGKTYILSGCPSGGGGSSYRLYPQSLGSAYYDNGEGATITVQEEKTVNIRCIIYPANTTATVTFKPMIRDASIADDTFDPYVTPTDEKKQDKPVELDITTEWTIAEWTDLLNKYNYLQIITYTDVSFDVVIVPLSIFSNITKEIRTVSYASHANNGSVDIVWFTSDEQRMVMTLNTNMNIYKIIGIPK